MQVRAMTPGLSAKAVTFQGSTNPNSDVINVRSRTEFDDLINTSDVPVLVKFTADWCPPCRSVQPHVEKAATENKGSLKVVTANVDNKELGQLAGEHGVSGIPTFILFDKGQPIERGSGGSKQVIKNVLAKSNLTVS